MIKLGTIFWLLLVSATGAAMFLVKYQVQGIEAALVRTAAATARQQREIRSLTAEWAYLNRPEGLAALNQRYLSRAPIATKQLETAIDDIPPRTPPAPAGADAVVAAAPAPATPVAIPAAPLVPATPALVAAIAQPATAGQAKSLDDLFARIAASRR